MRDWNTVLLTGACVVLGAIGGFTAGMIIAPFWIEVKVLESGAKAPALIEGYGDVYGGLIGGILALFAAWIVYSVAASREAKAKQELKAVYAGRLLTSVSRLFYLLDDVHLMIKDDPLRTNLVTYSKNMREVWVRALDDLVSIEPDPSLGAELDSKYRLAAGRTRSMLEGLRMLGEPTTGNVDKVFYSSFHHCHTLLWELGKQLAKIRGEK